MKFVTLAVAAGLAVTALSGCCGLRSTKCYPYPLYNYSPAKVCGSSCAPAPCAVPCAKPGCVQCR